MLQQFEEHTRPPLFLLRHPVLKLSEPENLELAVK